MGEPSHDSHGLDGTNGGLFIIFALALGIFCRRVLTKTRIPYTVMLLLLGILIGYIGKKQSNSLANSILSWTSMSPHLFLFIFLPALIYEGTNAIDYHIFRKLIVQMALLAGPGVIISSILIALFSKYIFDYNWDWSTSITFGAMLSATDPVAVVSLLKELGASKKLAILIEGESLFNDGTAMVMFTMFYSLMKTNEAFSVPNALGHFLRLAVGGSALGILSGSISIVLLSHIVDDPISEISITLVTCYGTFYLAEATGLHMSGVLAVVCLGLVMSSFGKTAISHVTEEFMHAFWNFLGYFANTLIFVLSGAVMVHKYNSDAIRFWDFLLLIILYISLHFIRGFVVLIHSPLLKHTGYGLSAKQGLILVWAGLRGAVGLALALMIEGDKNIPRRTRSLFMFHMAGIALLTLLINGSTTGLLLQYLKLDRGSFASKKIFETAVEHMEKRTEAAISTLKSDSFFTDTDWATVWTYIPVLSRHVLEKRQQLHPDLSKDINSSSNLRTVQKFEKSFLTKEDDSHKRVLSFTRKLSQHSCIVDIGGSNGLKDKKDIPGMPLANQGAVNPADVHAEFKIMKLSKKFKIEARHRFCNLLKASYWHQFETGFAGKHSTRALVDSVDKMEDAINQKFEDKIDDWEFLKSYCNVPSYLRRLYNIPVIGRLLGQSTFGYVSNVFDIATSFIYAHQHAQRDFSELFHGLEEHYDDIALRRVVKNAWASILEDSESSMKNASIILNDIQATFPEISRAVVTRQATYSIIKDMNQFSQNLLKFGEIEEKEFKHIQKALVHSRKQLLFHPPKIRLRSELEIIGDVAAFSSLSFDDLTYLRDKSKHRLLNKGDVIYSQGESTTGVYIIIRGIVSINYEPDHKSGNSNKSKVLDHLGPGRIIGILSYMTQSCRHTTIVCDTYVTLLFIDKPIFDNFIATSSKSNEITKCLWKLSGQIVSMRYIKEFNSISPTIIREMLKECEVYKQKRDTPVRIAGEGILLQGKLIEIDGVRCDERAFKYFYHPNALLKFEINSVVVMLSQTSSDLIGNHRGKLLEAIKSHHFCKESSKQMPLKTSARQSPTIPEFGSAILPSKSPLKGICMKGSNRYS